MYNRLFLSFVNLACISAEHLARHSTTAFVDRCQQALVAALLIIRVQLRQLQVAVNLLHSVCAYCIMPTVVALQS